MTSAGKAARVLVTQLCLEEAHTTGVALNSLAQHVQELTAFENDATAANRLDRHWRGLSTPFESISIGIKLRGFLGQKLSAFPLGTKVSAEVLSLNPDQIEMLGAHAGLGQKFQTMSPKLKSGLDGKSIDQFLAMLNPEIAPYSNSSRSIRVGNLHELNSQSSRLQKLQSVAKAERNSLSKLKYYRRGTRSKRWDAPKITLNVLLLHLPGYEQSGGSALPIASKIVLAP